MADWQQVLARVVDVRPSERRALLWSFAYFFLLLAAYYILRPLRDEMGIASGRDWLQWLFMGTFLVMLAASPVYAAAVARLPRARFVPLVYHFFVFNIAIFWLLLWAGVGKQWVARAFFVWVSVFNLFAVSVFWSFMADLYRTEQGKRLFGFIAAGGTAGTLLGSSIAVGLSGLVGPYNLLIIAAVLLEAAVFCVMRLETASTGFRDRTTGETPRQDSGTPPGAIGGGVWAGFKLILSSRYLAGIALWVALLSLAGTFLYFLQQDVVRAASTDPAVRTRIFAVMDLSASLLILAIQGFATGKLIERIGTGPAAAFLPLVFAAGFAALAIAPALAVIIAFQALQRTANFAIANPAREILFTPVEREEKYKAKNIIDTAVFRGGDVVWGFAMAGLRGLGLTISQISLIVVPVALGWLGLSLLLGRTQERLSANRAAQENAGQTGSGDLLESGAKP